MTTIRTSGWRRLAGAAAAIALVTAACGGDVKSDAEEPSTEETTDDTTADTTAPAEEGGDTDEVEVTQDGGILAAVQARGTLNCGASGAAVAFSYTQAP